MLSGQRCHLVPTSKEVSSSTKAFAQHWRTHRARSRATRVKSTSKNDVTCAEVRREAIKVKDGADVLFNVRSTRHGPLISDLEPEHYLHRRFSLAWTGFMLDDRTPEAFLKMNRAKNAAEAASSA